MIKPTRLRAALPLLFIFGMTGPALAQVDDDGPTVAEIQPAAGADLMAPDIATSEDATASASKSVDDVANEPANSIGEGVAAVRSGDWRKFAALLLSVVTLVFVKFHKSASFFKTDRGGTIAIFVISTGGALTTSLLGSQPIDFKMFSVAIEVGALAIGGYTGIRQLIWPKDKKDAK